MRRWLKILRAVFRPVGNFLLVVFCIPIIFILGAWDAGEEWVAEIRTAAKDF